MRIRLLLQVFGLEVRKVMSYRVDFWVTVVGGLIAGILIPYFLWQSIYAESGQDVIQGYTFRAMVIYYVLVVLLSKVVRGPDMRQDIAGEIYDGNLSRYLVYPISYLPFKYAQHLGGSLPSLVQLALFGTLFCVLLGAPGELDISPMTLALTLPAMAIANLLYFLLAYPLQAIAFWADNVWSLVVLLRLGSALLGGVMVPLILFPDGFERALYWTPFPYLFYTPVRTLMGMVEVSEWFDGMLVTAGWCVIVAVLGGLVWKRGERQYTGVGI